METYVRRWHPSIQIILETLHALWLAGTGTYQPPIAFSGSGNVYRGNRVGQVPHTYVPHFCDAAVLSSVEPTHIATVRHVVALREAELT